MRYGYDFKHAFATGRHHPCHIARQRRGERLFRRPFGMLRRHGLCAIHGEKDLKRQRLLGPESPVIIEYGNALWHGTKSAELSFVTLAMKSRIAVFVVPSFHEGSGSASPARLAWVVAGMATCVAAPIRGPLVQADVNTTASKSQGIGRHIYNPLN